MFKLTIFLLLLPLSSYTQTIGYRKYTEGAVFSYKLTTTAYRNDQLTGTTISVSRHRVVKHKGLFLEEISWQRKTTSTGQHAINQDTLALKVPPYKVSLSPKGKVLLPALTVPGMVGEITDLNTFYVAIAPALKVQNLSLQNRSFVNSELRQGNFADSVVILYGTDCIQVTQTLLQLEKEYAVIETKFTPPPSFCLVPLLDTVAGKSFGQFSNIQMIQKAPGGKQNLFWGVEEFTITSTIGLKSGEIRHAVMDNHLTLRMRCDITPDLKSYAVETPVTIKRRVELELMR